MVQFGGGADMTLVQLCMALEDNSEIREYMRDYLGSTPQVSSFASEFLKRKSADKTGGRGGGGGGGDGFSVPAAAGKKNRRKKNKGQKVDGALLGFSNAPGNQVNSGGIDYQ